MLGLLFMVLPFSREDRAAGMDEGSVMGHMCAMNVDFLIMVGVGEWVQGKEMRGGAIGGDISSPPVPPFI